MVSNNIFAFLILAQVLVLVHQVFLDLMTHSFFKLSDAALLIMDECHHAQVITRCLKGNSPNFCYLVSRLQNKGLFFQTLICYSKGLQLLFLYSDLNHNNVQGDKNHPYSQIMRDWYQRLKETRSPTPKVFFHFTF